MLWCDSNIYCISLNISHDKKLFGMSHLYTDVLDELRDELREYIEVAVPLHVDKRILKLIASSKDKRNKKLLL